MVIKTPAQSKMMNVETLGQSNTAWGKTLPRFTSLMLSEGASEPRKWRFSTAGNYYLLCRHTHTHTHTHTEREREREREMD